MTIQTIKYNISSRQAVENTEAAEYISKFTSCSIDTAVKRLSEGKSGFFHSDDLSFESNRKSHAKKTRSFIKGLIARNIDPYIIGITDAQSWYDVTNIDDFEVKVNDVLAQLKEFEK